MANAISGHSMPESAMTIDTVAIPIAPPLKNGNGTVQ